jgi:hypothetical protein
VYFSLSPSLSVFNPGHDSCLAREIKKEYIVDKIIDYKKRHAA